jgi:periplasmic divalent cation tolerance protein
LETAIYDQGVEHEHGLVLITCADRSQARVIAKRLVQDRLAAGVQILPIESVYTWQGEVVEDDEVLLIVKTRSDRFDEIRATVESIHSYQVPPIVMMVIDRANQPYLDWIDEALSGESG